ncbi:IS6 family transposase, partial [Salmonella enterica subsp. enterica serovar Panama]
GGKGGGLNTLARVGGTIGGWGGWLWVRKGLGFSGRWTVNDQNDLLARLFGLQKVNKA